MDGRAVRLAGRHMLRQHVVLERMDVVRDEARTQPALVRFLQHSRRPSRPLSANSNYISTRRLQIQPPATASAVGQLKLYPHTQTADTAASHRVRCQPTQTLYAHADCRYSRQPPRPLSANSNYIHTRRQQIQPPAIASAVGQLKLYPHTQTADTAAGHRVRCQPTQTLYAHADCRYSRRPSRPLSANSNSIHTRRQQIQPPATASAVSQLKLYPHTQTADTAASHRVRCQPTQTISAHADCR